MTGLPERIAEILAIDPAAPALEFDGRWRTWGELGATVDAVAAHIQPGAAVGVLLRNRPASVGVLLGVLRAGACVVTASPDRGTDRVLEDLESLGVGTIAGEPDDLERLAPKVRWLASDALGQVVVTGDAPVSATDAA